jgi:beta-glucosidase
MDMQGNVYQRALLKLVREGRISEGEIDEAVRRILRVKFILGLFERPYADPEEAKRIVKCREHIEAALEAARRSIVLLKNDGGSPTAEQGYRFTSCYRTVSG